MMISVHTVGMISALVIACLLIVIVCLIAMVVNLQLAENKRNRKEKFRVVDYSGYWTEEDDFVKALKTAHLLSRNERHAGVRFKGKGNGVNYAVDFDDGILYAVSRGEGDLAFPGLDEPYFQKKEELQGNA